MEMKIIWIVNYYSTPPEYASNPRHLEFAHYLMGAGYDVTIFSSGFLCDKELDLVPEGKFKEVQYGELKFNHIKSPHYKGNGLKRMLSIFQFAWRLFTLRKKFEKPDIILHNIHAPFDYPVAWCATCLKAKYIVEAWDLWPDSFVRFKLISPTNPAVKWAYYIERRLYERADKIIFTFEGGLDYLRERRWLIELGGKIDANKIYYINNGVNIDKFKEDKNLYQLQDEDLEDKEHFKIIYLGSIRLANNIKLLIDAASILKDNSKYKFLIYGDGSDRAYLEQYCKENNIINVVFKDKWIPFLYVPYVLSKSSLNILNYQKEFGNYGISSGKLFQYLASAKPICCNININYCLITKYSLGIAKQFDNSQEYADAIRTFGEMDNESYSAICNRVNEVAKQFDYKVLTNKLIQVIDDLYHV
jgi:glycosyltransferase involved in cell wall biosynthesis